MTPLLFALAGQGFQEVSAEQQQAILSRLYDGQPTGVYTSFRTYDHDKFLHLEDHLARLESSMSMLGWRYQFDKQSVRIGLHRLCTDYPEADARVRIDVLSLDESPLMGGRRVLISLIPFEPLPGHIYQSGVRVGIERALSRNQPEVKKAEFAVRRRWYLQRDPSQFECLLTDADDRILEGTTSNFFGVKDGVLVTAGEGVLEGIARKIVLKLAREVSIPIRLEPIKVGVLQQYSETALSSSSRGLVPIVQIGDFIIGNGRPGPVTKKMVKLYFEYVNTEIRPAV